MKLNGIDLNKLRIFTAVVEGKGYRLASESLGLSRSAISQAITSLETQMDVSLFHRSGTKILPTEAAQKFYEEVMRYQHRLEGALSRMRVDPNPVGGLIRVGSYLEFTKSKLMPSIESFLLDHPSTQIQFHFDSPSRIKLLLESGKLDLSISIYPHESRRIESRKLYEEELCLIGRKDLIAANAKAADIASLPVIDYFPSHLLFKRWWATHFKKAPTHLHTRAFAATSEMVLEMVERRLGIGVIPRYVLERASEKIHVIEPSAKTLKDHIWLNLQKISKRSPVERAFISNIEAGLR